MYVTFYESAPRETRKRMEEGDWGRERSQKQEYKTRQSPAMVVSAR